MPLHFARLRRFNLHGEVTGQVFLPERCFKTGGACRFQIKTRNWSKSNGLRFR